MRIVVAHSQLSSLGGGERVTLELLRGLSKRHDVTLWAGNYRPESTYPELATFQRREIAAWEWLTATPDADVVISQSFGASLIALRHPHTICYLHTLRSVYLRGGIRPDLTMRRWLDQRAVRHAAAVLTNSRFTAEQAQKRYRRPVEVAAPGVDAAYFALPASVGEYALYVGRLAPEKGLERLLTWSADLSIALWVVGAGEPDYVARLRAIAGPRVRFTGPLSGEALMTAYAGCRYLTFLPHEEEFGLAAVEAMASAKPVIAYDEGGLRELVTEGRTGYLVRSREGFVNASERLMRDDALCIRLGIAARTKAETYTWERFVRQIEATCDTVKERS